MLIGVYEQFYEWIVGLIGLGIVSLLSLLFTYIRNILSSYHAIQTNYTLQNRELSQLKVDFENFKNEMKQELLYTKEELGEAIDKQEAFTLDKFNTLSGQYTNLLSVVSNLSCKVDSNHSVLVQMINDNQTTLVNTLVEKLTSQR